MLPQLIKPMEDNNYKIEEINGVKVLFLGEKNDVESIAEKFVRENDIKLIIVGEDKAGFIDRLNGRSLSDFIIDPKNNILDISKLPKPETFEIKPLPKFEEPFISDIDLKNLQGSWQGEKKWYDQYTKRNRKKRK